MNYGDYNTQNAGLLQAFSHRIITQDLLTNQPLKAYKNVSLTPSDAMKFEYPRL
jgi:hypothetical protein